MRVRLILVACLAAITQIGAATAVMASSPGGAGSQQAVSAPDKDRADALAARDKDRLRELGVLAEDAPADLPFRRVDGTTGYASVILPSRGAPYTVPELAVRFPDSFEVSGNGTYLVKDDVVVGPGARLLIASDRVRALRLLSSPDRFVTITSWSGSIEITGKAWRRIAVTSWDPAVGGPDVTLSDGRAWLHTRRGSMSIAWADLRYLGFVTGSLSGVAWEGRRDDPTRGDVTGSTFTHNYFGAYTFEAADMRWRLNTFADNAGYGFDPHDHSNGFLVEFNRAYRNGTHGIIFSRECQFNVIRYNHSFDNGRHGIVLDDGPSYNPDGTARERQAIPSDNNTVIGNVVSGNEVGIVLDGGTGNTITGNIISGNRYGVRMKDAVNGNSVERNRVVGNAEFGIYLYNHSNENRLVGNTVTAGESGIVIKDSSGTQIDDNQVTDMHRHGLSLSGDVAGTIITNNRVSGAGIGLSMSRVLDPNQVLRKDNQIEGSDNGQGAASFWQPLTRWGFWALILAFPVVLGPWFSRLVANLRRLRPKPSAAAS